ncbi:MAG: hypothetical protein VYA84_14490 [Planctomycetota bacterium]|nr:hypothetical protein [Planctomycetota bacterium]
MRVAAILICLIVTSSVALVAVASWAINSTHRSKQNPLFSDAASMPNQSLLNKLIATLNPDVIKEYVAK